jgi:hypothetical protein
VTIGRGSDVSAEQGRRAPAILVEGDPLRCLRGIESADPASEATTDLLLIGVDVRRVRSTAGLLGSLRGPARRVRRFPAAVPQIIVVLELADDPEPWVPPLCQRWAEALHRHIQRGRGVDAGVTVLLAGPRTDSRLVAGRISELAHRPPGLTPAIVLDAGDISCQTIAQASTNDFI